MAETIPPQRTLIILISMVQQLIDNMKQLEALPGLMNLIKTDIEFLNIIEREEKKWQKAK